MFGTPNNAGPDLGHSTILDDTELSAAAADGASTLMVLSAASIDVGTTVALTLDDDSNPPCCRCPA